MLPLICSHPCKVNQFSVHIASSQEGSAAGSEVGTVGHVHTIHKYTETDRRLKKKEIKDLAKEMKLKAKEEKSIKSMWNLDDSLCTETDLTFRYDHKFSDTKAPRLQCHSD